MFRTWIVDLLFSSGYVISSPCFLLVYFLDTAFLHLCSNEHSCFNCKLYSCRISIGLFFSSKIYYWLLLFVPNIQASRKNRNEKEISNKKYHCKKTTEQVNNDTSNSIKLGQKKKIRRDQSWQMKCADWTRAMWIWLLFELHDSNEEFLLIFISSVMYLTLATDGQCI